MKPKDFDMGKIDIAWCPGCGNYGILDVLKQALAELEISPLQCVMVSGIGQAAKIPHYIRTHLFNGLHGRYLSAATAIKAVIRSSLSSRRVVMAVPMVRAVIILCTRFDEILTLQTSCTTIWCMV
jgi:pyruvate/2-oxoacid:ferredoxin oxidoreductase beta subunit